MSKSTRKVVLASVLALVVVVVVMQVFKPKPRPSKIRVGYIPIADCAQLYIATEEGFFREQAIEVETVSMAGGAKVLEALGAGSVDVGFSNVVSLILAHDAGLPFVALTGGPTEDESHREHAILVRRDSAIQKVADLTNKKVALNTRRNIDELMVTLLFKKHGVDPATVTFLEVPFPRMLGVLESGDVDAVAAIEPYVTLGLGDQSNRLLTYNYLEIQPETEISTYVATRRWVEANPEVARRFADAMRAASAFANANPGEVRELLTRFTRLESNQVKDVVLPKFSESLSEERLDQLIEKVKEIGWIRSTFPGREVKASIKR